MKSSEKPYRLIISGGGTGGHIYPAIAIAHAFKQRFPKSEVLFVGAKGRMEMEKVPKAGYEIVGLWISGLQRKITLKNLLFPLKLVVSLIRAKSIIKKFKPDVAVGVGGYASGPLLKAAGNMGIPTVLQEQNSYAGITNKWLAKNADAICVAYDNMDRFFPKEKIEFTGNPVRADIISAEDKKKRALEHFGLDGEKPVIFAFGGSLGAKTINESIRNDIEKITSAGVQILWQSGKYYYEGLKAFVDELDHKNVHLLEFVYEMDLAYSVADVVISRAGALSISELCLAGKACVLVPSPNVAEDHQTKNAKALVDINAAILIRDEEAGEKLVDVSLKLLNDVHKRKVFEKNIKTLAKPDAADEIVDVIEKVVNRGSE